MSSKSSLNGLNSCKCCPYGFHIDTDFVTYCEALLTALYGSKRMSQTLQCRTTSSLRRKINSAFSTLNSSSSQIAATDAFLTYCDYNYNNITANRNKCQNNKMIKSQSTTRQSLPEPLMIDNTLGDVVDKFEEAWLESRNRLSLNSDMERHAMESPPASPAPSSCTSSNISRVVLSQIRDQMALSLTRVKELEDMVKHIPNMRQQIIVLREEKKKLIRKLEGESDDNSSIIDDPQAMSRVRELEKSGLITPPMMRRKLLLKTESDNEEDEFGDIWMRTSPPPAKLISSKNIRLEELTEKMDASNQTSCESLNSVSVSTNTEMVSKATAVDCSTNTESKHSNDRHFTFDVLHSISIEPESSPIPTKQVPTRSIGISTSLAPRLPRKSVAIGTDLKASDTVSLRELEAKKPVLVSWGTDPIRIDSIQAQCQASPKTCDVSTKTEVHSVKDVGLSCSTKDFGITNCWTQTNKSSVSNKIVQVTEGCPKCELRQTETIGVGDNNVYGTIFVDKGIDTDKERPNSLDLLCLSPVSRASSAQSIRLCDKCNDAITSVAKEFIVGPNEKTVSPTIQSRIPRPIHSTGSLERLRLIKDKIIEESQNEILVYKNTKSSLSVGSSPIKSHPPLKVKDFSKKETPEEIKIIDDVFKITGISESDESDEEEESNSSDEGTYEVETGAVAKTVARKRVEPSKEIKAALKVLNDNLVKPEKANKSALVSLHFSFICFQILKLINFFSAQKFVDY